MGNSNSTNSNSTKVESSPSNINNSLSSLETDVKPTEKSKENKAFPTSIETSFSTLRQESITDINDAYSNSTVPITPESFSQFPSPDSSWNISGVSKNEVAPTPPNTSRNVVLISPRKFPTDSNPQQITSSSKVETSPSPKDISSTSSSVSPSNKDIAQQQQQRAEIIIQDRLTGSTASPSSINHTSSQTRNDTGHNNKFTSKSVTEMVHSTHSLDRNTDSSNDKDGGASGITSGGGGGGGGETAPESSTIEKTPISPNKTNNKATTVIHTSRAVTQSSENPLLTIVSPTNSTKASTVTPVVTAKEPGQPIQTTVAAAATYSTSPPASLSVSTPGKAETSSTNRASIELSTSVRVVAEALTTVGASETTAKATIPRGGASSEGTQMGTGGSKNGSNSGGTVAAVVTSEKAEANSAKLPAAKSTLSPTSSSTSNNGGNGYNSSTPSSTTNSAPVSAKSPTDETANPRSPVAKKPLRQNSISGSGVNSNVNNNVPFSPRSRSNSIDNGNNGSRQAATVGVSGEGRSRNNSIDKAINLGGTAAVGTTSTTSLTGAVSEKSDKSRSNSLDRSNGAGSSGEVGGGGVGVPRKQPSLPASRSNSMDRQAVNRRGNSGNNIPIIYEDTVGSYDGSNTPVETSLPNKVSLGREGGKASERGDIDAQVTDNETAENGKIAKVNDWSKSSPNSVAGRAVSGEDSTEETLYTSQEVELGNPTGMTGTVATVGRGVPGSGYGGGLNLVKKKISNSKLSDSLATTSVPIVDRKQPTVNIIRRNTTAFASEMSPTVGHPGSRTNVSPNREGKPPPVTKRNSFHGPLDAPIVPLGVSKKSPSFSGHVSDLNKKRGQPAVAGPGSVSGYDYDKVDTEDGEEGGVGVVVEDKIFDGKRSRQPSFRESRDKKHPQQHRNVMGMHSGNVENGYDHEDEHSYGHQSTVRSTPAPPSTDPHHTKQSFPRRTISTTTGRPLSTNPSSSNVHSVNSVQLHSNESSVRLSAKKPTAVTTRGQSRQVTVMPNIPAIMNDPVPRQQQHSKRSLVPNASKGGLIGGRNKEKMTTGRYVPHLPATFEFDETAKLNSPTVKKSGGTGGVGNASGHHDSSQQQQQQKGAGKQVLQQQPEDYKTRLKTSIQKNIKKHTDAVTNRTTTHRTKAGGGVTVDTDTPPPLTSADYVHQPRILNYYEYLNQAQADLQVEVQGADSPLVEETEWVDPIQLLPENLQVTVLELREASEDLTDVSAAERALDSIPVVIDGDAQNHKALGTNDGVAESVVHLLKYHIYYETAATKAFIAIATLCRYGSHYSTSCEENIQKLLEAGALEVVVSALIIHLSVPIIVELGCWVIRNLSTDNDHIRGRVGMTVACEVVISIVKTHMSVARITEAGLRAICNLSMYDATKDRFGHMGACEIIAIALRNHMSVDTVVEQAFWAARNLTYDNEENRRRFYEVGFCEDIIQALTLHMRVASVAEQGCWAIHNLSKYKTNRLRLRELGAKELVATIRDYQAESSLREAELYASRARPLTR